MWEDRLAELRTFSEMHGQCNLPKDYPQNRVLATWVKNQRRQYKLFLKEQKTSMMTTERVMKLTEIGFDWNPRKGDRKLNNSDDISASSESSSSLYI
jgi:predicted deacetylase